MKPCRAILAVLILGVWSPTLWADEPAPLAKARVLYNASDYEGAIDSASVVRREVAWADRAALIIARAHLEQYRLRATTEDLVAAREALASVHSVALTPRDRVDLVIGLGQALYFGEAYGAAAALFDTALDRAALLGARDRLLLLDWWATALDREAQTRAADGRAPLFERLAERMQDVLRLDPGNAAANYWLVVAARGSGDIDGAWDSAVAAWVRSTLSPDTTKDLRADLDRLMTQALIPERSRALVARDPLDALTALRTEWDLVKEQWK